MADKEGDADLLLLLEADEEMEKEEEIEKARDAQWIRHKKVISEPVENQGATPRGQGIGRKEFDTRRKSFEEEGCSPLPPPPMAHLSPFGATPQQRRSSVRTSFGGNSTVFFDADDDASWMADPDAPNATLTGIPEGNSGSNTPTSNLCESKSEAEMRKQLEELELQKKKIEAALKAKQEKQSSDEKAGSVVQTKSPPVNRLRRIFDSPINFLAGNKDEKKGTGKKKTEKSVVHSGDTSSSEDEDARGGSRLTEQGKMLKKQLAESSMSGSRGGGRNKSDPHTPVARDCRGPPSLRSPALSCSTSSARSDKTDRSPVTVVENPLFRKKALLAEENKRPQLKGKCGGPIEPFHPFFMIRVKNPRVSSMAIDGLQYEKLRLSELKRGQPYPQDWMTMGVIVHKGRTTQSGKGNKYMLWQLSDLRSAQDAVTVRVLLFGKALEKWWKVTEGTVVLLKSPQIMDSDSGEKKKDEISFRLMAAEDIEELGVCPDYGLCGHRRKDGQPCTNFVNISQSPVCVYHLVSASKTMAARRGELQSTSASGPFRHWEKKALSNQPQHMQGVKTVAYGPGGSSRAKPLTLAGVRSGLKGGPAAKGRFGSDPMISNLKIQGQGTRNVMQALADKEKPTSAAAGVSGRRRLRAESVTSGVALAQERHEGVKALLRGGPMPTSKKEPQIGRGLTTGSLLDLKTSRTATNNNAAMKRAVATMRGKIINKADRNPFDKGPGKPTLPARKAPTENQNSSAPSGSGLTRPVKKQEGAPASDTPPAALKSPVPKRQKLGNINLSDKEVKQIMEKKSSHQNEVDQDEKERQEKYFAHMEAKEAVEKRLAEVQEVKDVNVISCKKCNYTWHFQSDFCKRQGHLIQRHKATRRFFKCTGCSQRCVAYSQYPTKDCHKCGGKGFERTGMQAEKKGPALPAEQLLVRGEERPFVNS